MGKRVKYQGYTIESLHRQLVPREPCQLRIIIALEDHRGLQWREFLSDSFYPTDQEANLHGISYGPRLIDGKVPGLSVADMKMTDRRVTPRFRVQFRAVLCLGSKLEGVGIILDLSSGGCRVESSILVEAGMPLELRIYAVGIDWPLIVEEARVQWVSGQIFDLAFFRMSASGRQRLEHVIAGPTGVDDAA